MLKNIVKDILKNFWDLFIVELDLCIVDILSYGNII